MTETQALQIKLDATRAQRNWLENERDGYRLAVDMLIAGALAHTAPGPLYNICGLNVVTDALDRIAHAGGKWAKLDTVASTIKHVHALLEELTPSRPASVAEPVTMTPDERRYATLIDIKRSISRSPITIFGEVPGRPGLFIFAELVEDLAAVELGRQLADVIANARAIRGQPDGKPKRQSKLAQLIGDAIIAEADAHPDGDGNIVVNLGHSIDITPFNQAAQDAMARMNEHIVTGAILSGLAEEGARQLDQEFKAEGHGDG